MKAYLVVDTYGGFAILNACTDPNRALYLQQKVRRERNATDLPQNVRDQMCVNVYIYPIEVDTNVFYPLTDSQKGLTIG